MASVEIVTIGTEILLGHLIDTNSAHLAHVLADHGVDVYAKHSVGDNADRLAAMLSGVLERADGAITTGGLGPTVDDLTKDAVARAVGKPLVLHEPSLRAIEERFRSFGRTMTENNRRQAYLPEGCTVLENPHGTAPGFVALRDDGRFVACMPGVPREMKPMLEERLVPWLVDRFALREAIYTTTLHTVGIGESDLDRRIEDLFRALENPKIAVLAHGFRVDVKVMAKAESRARADAMARGARERLNADVALATTGIAGPSGGTQEKPVGLVWFALAFGDGEIETRRLTFPGNRADIRERATVAALGLLWRRIERDVLAQTGVP